MTQAIANSSGSAPQINVPLLGAPMVDPRSGMVVDPWQRIFTELFLRLGGSQANTAAGVYFQINTAGQIVVYSVQTNKIIGILQLTAVSPPPQRPVVIVAPSPQIYRAVAPGTLVFDSGQVELSRDGGASWWLGYRVGGALPMLVGDEARVTWFGPNPPTAVFFPTA